MNHSDTRGDPIADQIAPPRPKSGPTSWAALALIVVITFSAAAIGGLFSDGATGTWYQALNKPAFNPPAWVFGPVWTILYLMMAVAAWLVWRAPAPAVLRRDALMAYGVQLVANAAWPTAFFGLQSPAAGFVAIVALGGLIGWTAIRFARVLPLAAALLLPYALWVAFATVLNGAIWVLNA